MQGAIIGGAFVICTQSVGSPPPGGRAHGMGAGGSPCRSGRISGVSPSDQGCRGYRLRPIWVGQRGDLQGAINGRTFVVCSPIEIHPVRGGGRAGRGNGGTVRHCSCLGHPEQGGGGGGAISSRAFVVCANLLGARPLGGRAHGMGAGGSPLQAGRISGDSPPDLPGGGYRLRPIWVGQRGACREL